MATPTLRAVPVTGAAPSFAEPVEIYGLPSGSSPESFSQIPGSVPGVVGDDLQAILSDIVARLTIVESWNG